MWDKYANGHRGYCLEWVNHLGLTPFHSAREVAYGDLEYDLADPTHRGTLEWFFYKTAADYSNEEEVRLFQLIPDSQPYVVFVPQLLNRIILGKDMGADEERKIRDWAGTRKPELPVVRATWQASLGELVVPNAPEPDFAVLDWASLPPLIPNFS
jgi:hypothetical protein